MLYFKLLNEQLLINFLEEPRQLLKQLGQFLKKLLEQLVVESTDCRLICMGIIKDTGKQCRETW